MYSGQPEVVREHEESHRAADAEDDVSDLTELFEKTKAKLKLMSEEMREEWRLFFLQRFMLDGSALPGLEVSMKLHGKPLSVQEFVSLVRGINPRASEQQLLEDAAAIAGGKTCFGATSRLCMLRSAEPNF